jgi:magnesium transporter
MVPDQRHDPTRDDDVISTGGHDLKEAFLSLDDQDKEAFIARADDDSLADLIAYSDAEDAALILADLDLERQASVLERMEPDDAIEVIREMDEEKRDAVLETLDPESDIIMLAEYDEDETGSAMTGLFLSFRPEEDVKDVTRRVIREAPDVETVNTLFVTDDNGRLLGAVSLADLIKAKSPVQVKALAKEVPYATDTDQVTVTVEVMRNYGIYDMPVCDKSKTLLGIITLDDAMDIYLEEAQEDFEKLAALPETTDAKTFSVAFHRLPWLVALLALSIPIALVTSLYEEILGAVAILILFQPLILGSAGNVATQTLAVTLKSISTDARGKAQNAFREIASGMLSGLVIALVAFVMTLIVSGLNGSLTSQPFLVASIVGLSLWLTVFVAPVIATAVPIILDKTGVDPAVASGPFITTLIDIAALVIYFSLATLLLGGVAS